MENEFIELTEEELKELERKRKRKRFYIRVISLFLLFLLLIYLLPGDLLQIFEGTISSYKLNDDLTIDFKDSKIIFSTDVYYSLLNYYLSNQKTEIAVCLLGSKENDKFVITGIKLPRISGASVTHVNSEQCPADTIIPLHTHPYKRCIFSEQDIKSYNEFKKINPDAVIGLMCEPRRFNFYLH